MGYSSEFLLKTRHYLYVSCMLVTVSACSTPLSNNTGAVWEDYDYRHPVPYNSPVPSDNNTVYIQRDNDSDYVQPQGWGSCSPNDPMCE